MANCFKCGKRLGFLGGFVLGETNFCSKCYDSLSVEEMRKFKGNVCRECRYFYVDANYDSWCELTGRYADRDNKACEKFQ